jgi:selenocysteine-specific elongation factor
MIIATAGHVDHGKTSLVKALTGADTDRLPEEKRRGMSIDLGFAYLPAADGNNLAFIDVPGHERFIRNMIAGITGIDLGLLVIAADDGPMPQTVEHLQVLALLGTPQLLVALTKTDLADEARLQCVQSEIGTLLAATPFAGAPVFPLSTRSGDGVEALRAGLFERQRAEADSARSGLLRMNIDRAFSLKGTGLVVTGTVVGGSVAVGDEVLLMPGTRLARVRSLHANGSDGGSARRGQRCALNLTGAGIETAAVARGNQILSPGSYSASGFVDVRLSLLAGVPQVRKWPVGVTAYFGAGAAQGSLSVLSRTAANPSITDCAENARNAGSADTILARLSFADPVVVFVGDRLLLRHSGSGHLLGMGLVLDPLAPARGRNDPARLRVLGAIDAGDPAASLSRILGLGEAVDSNWLSRAFHLDPAVTGALANGPGVARIQGTPWLLSAARRTALHEEIVDCLATTHAARPEEPGLSVRELQGELQRIAARAELHGAIQDSRDYDLNRGQQSGQQPTRQAGRQAGQRAAQKAAQQAPQERGLHDVPQHALEQTSRRSHHDLLPAMLDELVAEGRLSQYRQFYFVPGHRPSLRSEDEALFGRLHPLLQQAGVRSQRVVELVDLLELERPLLESALMRMSSAGVLFRIARNRYFLPTTLRQLAVLCTQLVHQNELHSFTAADYRDASGLGRNLTIEVLEFFDNSGLTCRHGESRTVIADASIFPDAGTVYGRDTLPVERAGFKPVGGCLASLGSSTLSSSANFEGKSLS